MTNLVASVTNLLSGAYNYIASYFTEDRVSAVAEPAIELVFALEEGATTTAPRQAFNQLSPAMESYHSWTHFFYAILGRETPAMTELTARLKAIELPQVPKFSPEKKPADDPIGYIEEKRAYLKALQSLQVQLEEQGLREDYMRLLEETLPEGSSARGAYKEIKQHLSQLKGSIAYYQVGSDLEEIGKFGSSVQVSAVKSYIIKCLGESKEEEAYDLLVFHIKQQKLLSEDNLDEFKHGKDHPRARVLILQALNCVIKKTGSEYIKGEYRSIKKSYEALFPD